VFGILKRNSFEVSNAQKIRNNLLEKISNNLGRRLNWELYFDKILVDRIWDRILHSFGFELMQQSHLLYQTATPDDKNIKRDNYEWSYAGKITDKLNRFMDKNQGPIFAQIHSMYPRPRKGKDGKERSRNKLIYS